MSESLSEIRTNTRKDDKEKTNKNKIRCDYVIQIGIHLYKECGVKCYKEGLCIEHFSLPDSNYRFK
jgi:hypothetical protein